MVDLSIVMLVYQRVMKTAHSLWGFNPPGTLPVIPPTGTSESLPAIEITVGDPLPSLMEGI